MKILIAGDYCPQNRIADLFDKRLYFEVLGDVKKVVESVDYSIVNFECPVCDGNEKPIRKCGPNLKCSENGVEALKYVGFDCVTLANNHHLDYGGEGVKNTLAACKKYSIDTVGGGMNLHEASSILYKKVGEKKISIINCCEHEFSIATQLSAGCNPLNPIRQYYVIQEAKQKSDYVIVIVHGGNEHYQLPSPRMKEIYRFFVDAGADAVVNHHQHCYSGYEYYKGHPIVYGLGNFLFDYEGYRSTMWNEGYMINLTFEEGEEIKMTLLPYIQCSEEASLKFMDSKEEALFFTNINRLCDDIQNDDILEKKYEEWAGKGKKWILSLFEPYKTRLTRGLYYRGLLPSYIKNERLYLLLNYLICEAHFDQVKYILESQKRS